MTAKYDTFDKIEKELIKDLLYRNEFKDCQFSEGLITEIVQGIVKSARYDFENFGFAPDSEALWAEAEELLEDRIGV